MNLLKECPKYWLFLGQQESPEWSLLRKGRLTASCFAKAQDLSQFCSSEPRREATYEVPAVMPEPARIDHIQEELAALLQ